MTKYFLLLLCLATSLLASAQNEPYKNTNLPFEERAHDLVSRMTLEEKVSQTGHTADAVPRLGIPEYNWWNEGLHGVARAGYATVFPQAIGMAAMFDEPLMHQIATPSAPNFVPSTPDPRQGRLQRLVQGPHRLVSKYQYLSRPTLGTRPGNLW